MLGVDYRKGMMILGAESTDHIGHLARFMKWLPDVAEGVNEQFEMTIVLIVGHVALIKVAELGL